MQYFGHVRREIKRECKARTMQHLGRCVGLNILYMLPITLLSIIGMVTLYGNVFSAAARGLHLTETQIAYLVEQNMDSMGGIVLIWVLICGPLLFGQMKFFIEMRRGQEPSVCGSLFKPFTSLRDFWNGIKMMFCLMFRSFLWTIIPACIYSVLVAVVLSSLMFGVSKEEAVIVTLVAFLIWVLLLIPIAIKMVTYQAGWIVLHDNPHYGVWAATRDASSVFRGHYGKVAGFSLSFAPWFILMFVLTYGMVVLGFVGATMASSLMSGMLILILFVIAAICVYIILSAFVSAYVTTSLIGLYELFLVEQHNQYNNQYNQMMGSAPTQGYVPTQMPNQVPPQQAQPPSVPKQAESNDEASDSDATPPSAE